MSKAPRVDKGNKDRLLSPGPGAYDANTFVNKDKTPATSFGKTRRSEIVSKEDRSKLGPGNYELNSKKGGPCFTMGSKSSQKVKTDVPGPGNYDPNLSAVKDKVKSAKMGTS